MSRILAREAAFKLTFEYLFSGERNDQTLGMMLLDADMSEEDRKYLSDIYGRVTEEREQLTLRIMKYIEGYASPDRLVKTDLAIMLIAVCEILDMPDIPPEVSANEAVNLAKKYSTAKSGAFINGILSSVIKEIKGA